VDDAFDAPTSRQFSFQVHELALISLGTATTLALLAAGQCLKVVTLETAGLTILYTSVLLTCRGGTERFRIRLFASYGFVVWFYSAVARITPALGTTLRDGTLFAIDKAIFGQTPAVFCEQVASVWLTDLLSLCYLTYHFYLVIAVVHAAVVPNPAGRRLSIYLFTAFAIGFAGYLMVLRSDRRSPAPNCSRNRCPVAPSHASSRTSSRRAHRAMTFSPVCTC